MHFMKRFLSKKPPRPPLPCDICGRNIAKYNVWTEIRICTPCEKVFCNSCMKNLKRGRCDKCGEKTVKTQRILEYPPNWKRTLPPPTIETTSEPQTGIAAKFCRFCGGEYQTGDNICSNCGTPIDSE